MTRITNADQVLLLLRSHLQRSERFRRGGAPGKSARSDRAKSTPLERVQSIARNAALSDEEIERALISSLFTEEFGSAMANDPEFQTMVDEVLNMIRQEPTARELLARAVAQLLAVRK